MQAVSFSTVDDFLDFLPDDELLIVRRLRNIVLDCIPDVREKLSYNVPYYSRRRTICFIWPAAITWGGKKGHDGVRFGFTYGHMLRDELGYLDRGTRKQVYWRDFLTVKDIDEEVLRAYIFEALDVDEAFKTRRR